MSRNCVMSHCCVISRLCVLFCNSGTLLMFVEAKLAVMHWKAFSVLFPLKTCFICGIWSNYITFRANVCKQILFWRGIIAKCPIKFRFRWITHIFHEVFVKPDPNYRLNGYNPKFSPLDWQMILFVFIQSRYQLTRLIPYCQPPLLWILRSKVPLLLLISPWIWTRQFYNLPLAYKRVSQLWLKLKRICWKLYSSQLDSITWVQKVSFYHFWAKGDVLVKIHFSRPFGPWFAYMFTFPNLKVRILGKIW